MRAGEVEERVCPLCSGLRLDSCSGVDEGAAFDVRASAPTPSVRAFVHAHGRDYFECLRCGLVFLAPEQRLSSVAERAHYGSHDNRPDDPRYRAFLARVATPLVAQLPPGASGLDYGSGPGPTLSVLLEEQGFSVALYDPFFAPDPEPLERTYDFVTCTEAAEHFFEPGREFARLDALLRPGGWLGLMTELVPDERPFPDWYYARDPTHVSLFRATTLDFLARRFGWVRQEADRNAFLFRKGT